MAQLSAQVKSNWKKALADCRAPWILSGIDGSMPVSERLTGMAGLLDWKLHGQVSRLLVDDKFPAGEFCLIPGAGASRPSFLFWHYGQRPALSSLLEKFRSLQLKEVAIASSTFPEDFLAKLKENLKKEGIRWMELEST